MGNEIGIVFVQECEHPGDDFGIVPHQHMATRVVANELGMWDMACDELCVHVCVVQIIFGANRKRGCGDRFQGLREIFDSQLSLK